MKVRTTGGHTTARPRKEARVVLLQGRSSDAESRYRRRVVTPEGRGRNGNAHATYHARGSSSDSGWVSESPWGHHRRGSDGSCPGSPGAGPSGPGSSTD